MSERAVQTVKNIDGKNRRPLSEYARVSNYTLEFWIFSSRIVDEQEIIIYRSNNQLQKNNKEITARRIQKFLEKQISKDHR